MFIITLLEVEAKHLLPYHIPAAVEGEGLDEGFAGLGVFLILQKQIPEDGIDLRIFRMGLNQDLRQRKRLILQIIVDLVYGIKRQQDAHLGIDVEVRGGKTQFELFVGPLLVAGFAVIIGQ